MNFNMLKKPRQRNALSTSNVGLVSSHVVPSAKLEVQAVGASGGLPPITTRSVEQYWAARALTAETLLVARAEHHREMRAMAYSEESKRTVSGHDRPRNLFLPSRSCHVQRELSALGKMNDERITKLERLIVGLSRIESHLR